MRSLVPILTFLLLTACAEGGLPPLPIDQVRARFPAGGVVDVIEIDAVDRLALRKVELIAPDGQATPAPYLTVNPSPSVTDYQDFATAPIPLPDPVEYRRDWRNYRIRLSFGNSPDEVETREVTAPEPPPGE